MKMTSRIALVAAAGFLIGAATPAKAADLGDGCCADLEERVAELEATTARKGNRVVSLQVYGQVNKAILFFDTDFDDDAYIVDNDASGSRFGFTGSASVKPGVTAGYRMEIDVQDAASNLVDDGAAVGEGPDFLGIPGIPTFVDASVHDDPADEIKIRHNYLWIESETLGRVSLGQQSSATDGIAGINLANALSGPSVDVGSSLTVAPGLALAFPFSFIGATSLDLGDLTSDIDGPREDVIKYDSPSIYGFILSAAWGDDDFYDIALRFSNEWNSIRFAAGIGYQDGEDDGGGDDFEKFSGSASIMHVPTGLYATVAAGEQEEDGFDAGEYWFLQAGIEKRFFSYGATTIYGEYAEYSDFGVGESRFNFGPIPLQIVTGSEVERWGFGVVQTFDSAAMDIYAQAQFFDIDVDSFGLAGDVIESSEVTTFLIGSRIKF
jgi:predicted porin